MDITVESTALEDVKVITPDIFQDRRGFFMETFRRDQFLVHGLPGDYVQDNHSRSIKDVLRGLHYQIKQPQGKLVRVVSGEVFDVAVDIRKNSPTFGKWVGESLSAENKRQLWVPEGFAHGFMVVSESAEFLYKTTDYYAPEHERCIAWDDADLDIDWPLAGQPVVSDKDKQGRSFRNADYFTEEFANPAIK